MRIPVTLNVMYCWHVPLPSHTLLSVTVAGYTVMLGAGAVTLENVAGVRDPLNLYGVDSEYMDIVVFAARPLPTTRLLRPVTADMAAA